MNWIERIIGAILTTCLCLGSFAEAANPKSDELVLAKKWSEEHLGREVTVPPFAFTYGGQPSTEFLKDWTRESSSTELDDGRTQQTLTWTDPRTGLEVRCEVVNYRHFPTVEWTVYLANKGTSDTPILENIKALDMRLERATKDKKGEFLLHHHVGSPASRFDYAPLETPLPPKATKSVGAKGGRPTNSDWSYFNLEWDGRGMIVVLGWPGQWSADFRRDAGTGLQVEGGQELTHLKLYPGEEIRTPLVVLQFWKGGDWIDAQNVWRRWMLTYNVPRVNGKPPAPQLAGATCYLFNFTKNTEENQNFFIRGFREKGLRLDSWWIDAGWYPCGDNWPKTGSWWPDPARFPRGLKAISECAHANNVKLIVWCEPERVAAGTWLTQTHPEWILGGAKGGLLNLGDPEALRWATDHFDKLLTEQGIDVYRQDFNMDPLDHWRRNDGPDRQGMTEMRHVLGYLKFWDELRHRHPDLLIDSCASGGRRNDLETMRRSVPLWRSDYVYEAVGEQIHTYGISFWIPYHGSGHTLVLQGDKKEIDLYAFRSNLYPCIHAHYDVRRDDLDYDRLRRLIGQWEQMSEYYYGDYYPLTACSSSGTLEDQTWMAWQFNRPASGDGMVQAFRRSRCNLYAGRFPLRGLQSDAQYEIVDLDHPNPTVATGKDLLEKGLPITIPDKPGAVVVIYKKRSPTACSNGENVLDTPASDDGAKLPLGLTGAPSSLPGYRDRYHSRLDEGIGREAFLLDGRNDTAGL